MDGRAFYDAVMADPDLVLRNCHEGKTPADDYVEVVHRPTGCASRIPVTEILRHKKDDLFGVMKFKRKPKIMQAMSGDAGSYGQLPCVSRSIEPVAIAS